MPMTSVNNWTQAVAPGWHRDRGCCCCWENEGKKRRRGGEGEGGERSSAEKYVSLGKAAMTSCWESKGWQQRWRRLCGSPATGILAEPAGVGGWCQGTHRDHSREGNARHWFGCLLPWKKEGIWEVEKHHSSVSCPFSVTHTSSRCGRVLDNQQCRGTCRRKADKPFVEELEKRQEGDRELLPPGLSSPGEPMQGCDGSIYTRTEVLWEDGEARCEDQAGQAGFVCSVVSLARHLGWALLQGWRFCVPCVVISSPKQQWGHWNMSAPLISFILYVSSY